MNIYCWVSYLSITITIIIAIIAIITIIMITRPYAALGAAALDWIVGPGYSSDWYILECLQRLALRLWRSARLGYYC